LKLFEFLSQKKKKKKKLITFIFSFVG